MWQHFVAMGDSLTEGVGDPVDGIEMLGWADRFHRMLLQESPECRYTNLAGRGLVASEVRGQQLELALALLPDLVSVVTGGNDILKGYWNGPHYEAEIAAMLEELTATGATVLTSTIPDFRFLAVPPDFKERVTQQVIEVNTIIRRMAQRFDVRCAEAWNHPATLELNFWSADGVHPNAFGYSQIATEMAKALRS